MRKFAAALVLACALLVTGAAGAATGRTGSGARASAVPALNWGVADDASKFADDGGAWFYGQLHSANLTENRWTLFFDPNSPTAITELPFFERAAPAAQAAGIHVVLALYGRPATANDPTVFCTWAAQVATLAKHWGIHDFIVWNEPNTALYWSPQDASAPAKYEALLAQCYDMIHAADAQARVIGFGLSPRSNGPSQTGPLAFIAGVGAAYKASGRQVPIMDQLSIHPYPNPNNPTDGPDVGYKATTNYGVSNLDRVKQAIYDAFNGTKQPTTVNGLTFRIDELGWQTDTTTYSQYYNNENVKVVSEQQQADYLKTTAEKYFACDPTVTDVELFLLTDEPTRNGRSQDGGTVLGGGWQSGLLTAGGQGVSQPKPAYAQLASDFAAGRGACKGAMISWTPKGVTTGGSASGASGGTGTNSATLGDPNGLLDPNSLDAFLQALETSNAIANAFLSYQLYLTELIIPMQTRLINLLDSLHAADGTTLSLSGALVACAGTCSVDQMLSIYWASLGGIRLFSRAGGKVTKVATFASTITAGKKARATLKPVLKKNAKAPVGTYFLVGVLKNKADATQRYGFGAKVRSVKAKPAKKHSTPAKKQK